MESKLNLKKFGKCQTQGHSRHDIIIICLEKSCKEKRLGCSKCICENHSSHPNKCLFIDDIFIQSKDISQSIPNWTNSQLCEKLDKMIEKVDESKNEPINLEIFREQIQERLQEVKESLKKNYIKNKEESINFTNQIKTDFQTLFDLTKIQQYYSDYIKKVIGEEEFQKNIQVHLNDEQRKKSFKSMEKQMKLKNRVCLQLSKTYFDEIKSQIIKEISLLQLVIRSSVLQFVVPQINQNINKQVKTLIQGNKFEFSSNDSQSYIYSSHPLQFQNGEVEFSLKFENMTSNLNYNTYVGVLLDDKKDDFNQIFQQGKCIYLDIMQQGSHSPYFQILPNKKAMHEVCKKKLSDKESTTVTINFNIHKKQIQYSDDTLEAGMFHSAESVKKQVGQNLFQYQQTENFYNKKNKYRAFVMGYSCNYQVSIVN